KDRLEVPRSPRSRVPWIMLALVRSDRLFRGRPGEDQARGSLGPALGVRGRCPVRPIAVLTVPTEQVRGGYREMPFKSQAQRRKFAQLLVEGKISNQTFEEWNRETGGAKLPER